MTATAEELELAQLIVTSLNIEQFTPQQIDPDAPLFGGSLGLDSIDALEIALAVSRHYGIHLRADHADNRRIFASLRALSDHIQRERAAATASA
jgi:acyl carrier protein